MTGTTIITQLVEGLAFVRSSHPAKGILSSCGCGLDDGLFLQSPRIRGGDEFSIAGSCEGVGRFIRLAESN